MRTLIFLILWLGVSGVVKGQLFREVPTQHSGIGFENSIEETIYFNYYSFMHIYMGGGVATGDFNNDGLPDIYFVGNMTKNKLYLNKGSLQFEDITEQAGVGGSDGFYTGVTTVDINQDGYLDIYVCRSGPESESLQSNLLYINNGDLTFSEKAFSYGLSEDYSHSIQASFFDYDKDGDLDMYLVNTPVKFDLTDKIVDTDIIYTSPSAKGYGGNDKLFQNNGRGSFTDVSDASGIKSDIFFGLSVSIGDINNDSWQDIYVANDFSGPDFCYLNNADGTFTESNQKVFAHTSMYSMGSDMGDLNNDGYLDLMVLDMLPQDYKRSKTSMTMMPRNVMQSMVAAGYHKQYMHNMVQLNTSVPQEKGPFFREVAQYAGLHKSDWSWSCLLEDFNLDGSNDVYITNGIYRDVTNVDSRLAQKEYVEKIKKENNYTREEMLKSRALFPSVKLKNYLFLNNGNLTFSNVSESNAGAVSFSNGSALADFDNDGDIDIVCNNVNQPAFLLENLSARESKYLKLILNGPKGNRRGIGARVEVKTGEITQIKEQRITRGYFSASDDKVIFGLGGAKKVDKLKVKWPDGRVQVLKKIKANQTLKLSYNSSEGKKERPSKKAAPWLEPIHAIVDFIEHKEKPYDDYQHQLLLPHKLSALGPALAKGDFNQDGKMDFFISAASGFASEIYFQTNGGSFIKSEQPDLETSTITEDTGVAVFDFDGDSDLDMYIVCGSYEFEEGNKALEHRLYLNDGEGKMTLASGRFPPIFTSASCAIPFDLEGDGDQDLFIGGRVLHGKYPLSPKSYLLENISGKFVDVTLQKARELYSIGMVTDVEAFDIDRDGDQDLIMVGEWMPITLIENQKGNLINITQELAMHNTTGWWNTIELMDIDDDGDEDFLVGNLGLNYKFHASQEKPLHVYADDLDNQGVIDIVLAKQIKSDQFPVRGKMCSSEQMPFINEKFPTFNAFAEANVYDIYGSNLDKAIHIQAREFRSSFLINMGNKKFTMMPMNAELQLAPVNAFWMMDIDEDGKKDFLAAGNLLDAEVETTPGDAGIGQLMLNAGNGTFSPLDASKSGFFQPECVKDIISLKVDQQEIVLVAENNQPLKAYKVKRKSKI